MSLLGRLFGGGTPEEPTTVDYEGFTITPTPIKEGSKFRLSAKIAREVDGEVKEHILIRADTLDSQDQADEAAVNKAKQMIDQMGLRVFD